MLISAISSQEHELEAYTLYLKTESLFRVQRYKPAVFVCFSKFYVFQANFKLRFITQDCPIVEVLH